MADIDTNLPTPTNNTTPATADNGLPAIPVSGGHIEQNNFIQHGDGTQIGEVHGDVNVTNNINVTDEQLARVLAEMFKGAVPVPIPDTPSESTDHDAASTTQSAAIFERPTPIENHPRAQRACNASPSATLTPAFISHADEWNSLSTEQYCLFVLENEEYNFGSFSISKECALRYTDEETYETLRFLDAHAIKNLESMPCIFAKRNSSFGSTDSDHPAVLGKLIAVINQGKTIKFTFNGFQAIPQQVLNENVLQLNMARASLRNELDEEHWSIKNADLIALVNALGITVR